MIDGATPHLQPCPGARTGFVFICPGRHEARRGYPCAAGTGANLNRVLAVLQGRRPDWFASADRLAYVVTNAWPRVEYPALTGRSVPTEAEVLAPDNLARLAAELAALDLVVACGAQAQAAVRALAAAGRLRARTVFGRHLSQRSVNTIPGGSDTPSRIGRWCDDLVAQLGPA
jgi:uracil-DNA glycosylase